MPHKSVKAQVKRQPGARTQGAKVRAFAAINRVRKGKSATLTAAARAENTAVRTIRRLLPAALMRGRGGRIRVKAGDPYSAPVEIVVKDGPVDVIARGSRERDLAGQHRTVYIKVLGKKLPTSALKQFRGKKVGGHELISNYERLSELARSGALDHLISLYVSPGTHA